VVELLKEAGQDYSISVTHSVHKKHSMSWHKVFLSKPGKRFQRMEVKKLLLYIISLQGGEKKRPM